MNHIKANKVMTPYGYEEKYWHIDGKSLPEYLGEWAEETQDKYLKEFGWFTGMCPAWSKKIDWPGDIRFVWKLIEMDSAILPLLLCEEDTDFSCVVIVAEVERAETTVRWKRIGYVRHENENFEEEKRSGILCVEAYSQEDWDKYGDNIALEDVDSPIWCEWISENWEEELYRRRMNYTLPYYQTEGNICWIKKVDWEFYREEYDKMVEEYRE